MTPGLLDIDLGTDHEAATYGFAGRLHHKSSHSVSMLICNGGCWVCQVQQWVLLGATLCVPDDECMLTVVNNLHPQTTHASLSFN